MHFLVLRADHNGGDGGSVPEGECAGMIAASITRTGEEHALTAELIDPQLGFLWAAGESGGSQNKLEP